MVDASLLPLSALQHLLYCPRQCALIHLEQAWAENRFTAEGRILHDKAHSGTVEKRPGLRITRSLSVRSERLGLSGQCDIVEFHDDGRVLPVEYKRGKPKAHRADEVQLCAQALCLEEMLNITITAGCLFYGQNRRRSDIPFDQELRDLTVRLAKELHAMIASRQTPRAVYAARKCEACSLIHLCQPHAFDRARGTQSWFQTELQRALHA